MDSLWSGRADDLRRGVRCAKRRGCQRGPWAYLGRLGRLPSHGQALIHLFSDQFNLLISLYTNATSHYLSRYVYCTSDPNFTASRSMIKYITQYLKVYT